MIRRLAALSLTALALAAAPSAQALDDPLATADDQSAWSEGMTWGIAAGGATLLGVLGLLYYLGVGGLRHIDRENVLEHPLRADLMASLREEPGLHLRELANRHDTAVTNTQWHLRKLEMAELVRTQKVQGRRLYYPVEGGIAARAVALRNAALRNPNAASLIEFITANPGMNQRALSEALDMNPGTVRWHLRRLEAAGLLRALPDGAQILYFATQEGRGPATREPAATLAPVEVGPRY